MDRGLWHCIGDRAQDHPQEKKCKKAKWLSEEALQIAVKRREAKSQGEKERYKHLNAEFQRIVRWDKKAFLSDQCKKQRKTIEWERLEISSIQSHHFMANRWGNSRNSGWLYFGGLQKHCRWWSQPWNKKKLILWKESCDQPRQYIKSRDITLPKKVCLSRLWFFQ